MKPLVLLASLAAALNIIDAANQIKVEHAVVPSISHLPSAQFKERGVIDARDGYQLSLSSKAVSLKELCVSNVATSDRLLYVLRLHIGDGDKHSVLITRPLPIDCQSAMLAREILTLHFADKTAEFPFHADYSTEWFSATTSPAAVEVQTQIASVGPTPRLEFRRIDPVEAAGGSSGSNGKADHPGLVDQKEQTFFQKYVSLLAQ